MMQRFSYRKSSDEVFNSLIETTLNLARAKYEGKEDSGKYAEENKKLLQAMGKKAVEGTRYEADFEAEGLDIFKRPAVKSHETVRSNFNAVIAEVITAIVPEVVNNEYSRFIGDVKQVGFGETARFIIESNDLFVVNQKAEGVRKGVDQPMFDDEITLNASPLTIDAHIDWYPFVAGEFDMGNFALKIARSYSAWIFIKIVRGMTAASTQFGAAYTVNGVTPALWGKLTQRVSAANGGMRVIALGTKVALSNVSLTGNFQVEIGEEMNKVGYLDQYLGTPLIALDNALVPGTTNSSATLVLPDDRIYIIPVAGSRPVKVLMEGDEVAVTFDPEHTSDKRYGISIEYHIGVSAICGSKYGTIEL